MRTLLIGWLTLSLIPLIADANGGGGGTKGTSTIKVRNQGVNIMAVIVDGSLTLDRFRRAELTASGFIDAGGQFVGRNNTATFGGLQSGDHIVFASYVSSKSNSPDKMSVVETVDVIRLERGRSRSVTATGSVDTGVQF